MEKKSFIKADNPRNELRSMKKFDDFQPEDAI
jgi:hypothetical protein